MENASEIIISTAEGVQTFHVDGLPLGEILEEALGYTPDSRQVRVDGAEVLGGNLNSVTFHHRSVVQVLSPAVAAKGVSGA